MNYQTIIRDLSTLGERQFGTADQARAYIEGLLESHNISFSFETYETVLPFYTRSELEADGVVLESQGCGLVSGDIIGVDTLLSSLISSQKNLYDANINFNPRCVEISRSNHYQAPALAVRSSDVSTLLSAQRVRGVMEVEQRDVSTGYFLIGNQSNPASIVVSHFDSIGPGAVDNASGVALTLELIAEHPELLTDTLFIIDGNEEVSFDDGIYWGHGYRVFESRYRGIIEKAAQIMVLDSFGYSEPELVTDVSVLLLAFPIERIKEVAAKTTLLSGSYEKLMEFYHAANDSPERITPEYWEASKKLVLSRLGLEQ